jgi:hypothetical protein
VKMVDFDLSSESALAYARLVIVIRGAIGFEAVIRRKPVLSLGDSMYNILPPCMVVTCRSLHDLPSAIQDMLANYAYDHNSVVRYLTAVIKGSVPVNLISDLLGKKGRFRTGVEWDGSSLGEHPHMDVLADYLYTRIRGSER